MATLFIYIIKWALCLALLYIPFALLLRKETFATLNRWLLIGIIVVSAILPAIVITYQVEVEIIKLIDDAGNTIADETVAAPPLSEAIATTEEGFHWRNIFTAEALSVIYIIGVAIAIIIHIVEIARIITSIKRGTKIIGIHNGMTVHCHNGKTAPFSWFGHIVISHRDYQECGKEIMLHEEGHCRNGHSWDMLLLSVVKSLQWFNPFVYMLAHDINEIHEYEADRHVLKQHGDTRAYQLLLLRKAVGETAFNLANNFNQSSVRKRIMMMARKPSRWINKGKVLSFAPMALLFLFLFAEPEYIYSTIEQRGMPTAEEPVADDTYTYGPPAIESTPQPLHILPSQREAVPERIEPIKAIPLSEKGVRLAEKFEEHATETYCEYIDIEGSELGSVLGSMNVKKCSVRMQFVVDKNGNAHSVTTKGCNVSMAGSAGNIEECKSIATEAATKHILAKEWQPEIKHGESICTIYDAHLIMNFGETRSESNSVMMAGSTPIN